MARLGDSLDDDVSVGISDVTKDEFEKIRFTVTSPNLAAASVDQYMWICPFAAMITDISEVHITAGSSGEMMVVACGTTGVISSTGNTDLLTSAFDLTSAVETPVSGTLSTGTGALTLAVGDKIGIEFQTTGHASLAGSIVTVTGYQN